MVGFRPCGYAEITIPSQYRNLPVIEITGNAFQGFDNIETVSIPATITTIGSNAFSGCTALADITIPPGVKTISSGMFSGCTSLTAFSIPASVTTIGAGAFCDCPNITSFTVDSLNPNYISVDGIIYTKSQNGGMGTELTAYSGGNPVTSFTIPNGITNIAPYAFSGCTKLETVILPVDRFIYCGFGSFGQTGNFKIIVPYNLRQNYQSNAFWAPYINNFETPSSSVTFNTNGGSSVQGKTIFYGESIELPEPARNGFIFAGGTTTMAIAIIFIRFGTVWTIKQS